MKAENLPMIRNIPAARPRREGGFSLIELMIAVALGLIILAALTSFFVSTSANRSEMERNTRQLENGRYAIDTLREDLNLAGFYADLAPGVTPAWATPAACPAAIGDLSFTLVPAYAAPVPIFGYALGAGAPATCVPDIKANTDVVVVRRFNTEAFTLAQAQASTPSSHPANRQFYIQISECSEDPPLTPFVVDVGSGAGFSLRKLNCTSIADLWRLREHTYYVRTWSTVAGDNIPTLVRREVNVTAGGVVVDTVPLVEGIDNLRVDYGVDNTGDGQPDVWTRCDAASPCDATAWANVTAAKIYVLSRNIDPTPNYTDKKLYSLGLWGKIDPAIGDAYKRHVYSTQIVMPNRSGPREPQMAAAPP